MQRVFPWFPALLALYVSGFACATDNLPPPQDEPPAPHIALLLPLKSALFGPAADAVRQGFAAAADAAFINPKSLPVRVYGSFDEGNDIVALYRHALASGARGVVGPLTRNGVAALVEENDIPTPTLALNLADSPNVPRHLYFFGMAAEAEARTVAQLALRQGHPKARIIVSRSQLAQRLRFAFEEEWERSGRSLMREIPFDGDPAVLAGIAAPDAAMDTAIFLAGDAAEARRMRPFLPKHQPIYATSQVFAGNEDTLTNYDLDGVRFVDMPWLLQPDHPAVMVYPRADPPLTAAHERLYALGIDAFRLMELMLGDKLSSYLPLDGVSGRIHLEDHVFQRTAIPAHFEQGQAVYGNTAVLPAARMFPDQPAAPAPPDAAPLQ